MEDVHLECCRESVALSQRRCRIQLNTAFRHEQDSVGELECQVQLMGRDKDSLALLMRQVTEQLECAYAVGQVEMRCGFVEQNDGCLLGKGFGYEDTLLLSVAVGVEIGIRHVVQAHLLQCVSDNRLIVSG